MVKVGVIGTGFVGLTHASVTALYGHNVIGYDIDSDKIAAFNSRDKSKIEKYIYEKGLSDILCEQHVSGRLTFTNDVSKLSDREVLFMCLPTPYLPSGESDMSYLLRAAKSICDMLIKHRFDSGDSKFVLFVNKSTVPIGTAKMLKHFLLENGLKNFDVASNPEFLPEGDAVNSAVHSKKIVVGCNSKESFDLLRKVYSTFIGGGYIETNPETAEAIKYSSNALLFSQIVAWQSIPGKIAEGFPEVDFDLMKKGIIADERIAKWGSYISSGAGGSCFKKDALSLAHQLNSVHTDSRFVNLINTINEDNKHLLLDRVINSGYSFANKKVALLGVAFKQETNDIRESNALAVVSRLLELGVNEIRIYDPLALDNARKEFDVKKDHRFSKISYHNSANDALIDTDVSYIATDHREFTTLGQTILEYIKHPHLILDGRRRISKVDIDNLLNNGVSYISVGGTYKKSTQQTLKF